MTVSPWAGVKLSLHFSCVTKWASPKNRPARCKSLRQTVVYPCPFHLLLSKSTAERVWLCHPYPRQSSATHARYHSRETSSLACTQVMLPRRRQLITTWVLPSIQTALITVNGIEKGGNKSELVQHNPKPPQGLQTHSQYYVEANKQPTLKWVDRSPTLIIYAMPPRRPDNFIFSVFYY